MNPVPPRIRMRSGFSAFGVALPACARSDARANARGSHPNVSAPPVAAEAIRKLRRSVILRLLDRHEVKEVETLRDERIRPLCSFSKALGKDLLEPRSAKDEIDGG